MHKAFPALHYLHAAFVLPDDPATLNPEEQKKATILLCKTLYTRLNVDYYSQEDLILNLKLECHNRFGQWKETILKHLEDEEFRKELILEVFKAQGKLFPQNTIKSGFKFLLGNINAALSP